jgi:exopolysaccharide production protein ExoQ
MPPSLALLLSLGLSLVLVWREVRHHPDLSKAVWIPCLWVMILGSRSVSQWLNLGTPTPVDVDVLMDGSPADRMIYALLMVSAILVLWSRRLAWTKVVAANPWLTIFFVYCAVSVLWSDFPGVALKRWFKSLGDPLMVLVLLSEASPAAAIASVLRRCAFVLVPLSIVFIKYYPHLGRAHDLWSGVQFYTGVTTNKNMLGYLLLVFGLYFVCALVTRAASDGNLVRKMRQPVDTAIAGVFLLMIVYLFRMADSITPLLALLVALGIVAGVGIPLVRRNFGLFASVALVFTIALQLFFGAADLVIESTGRDSTFTGRTEVWAAVLGMTPNPLLGAGFHSFWLGERLHAMWELFPVFRPNQAHNGYIDLYLNLGFVGLFIVAGVIVTAYRAASYRLAASINAPGANLDDLVFAKFGLSYLVAFLLYNFTEASFQSMNLLFVVFLLISLRVSLAKGPQSSAVELAPLGAGAARADFATGENRWCRQAAGAQTHSRVSSHRQAASLRLASEAPNRVRRTSGGVRGSTNPGDDRGSIRSREAPRGVDATRRYPFAVRRRS